MPYQFVTSILTKVAAIGGLNKIFDRDKGHLAQSSPFMDTFVQCALKFS